MPWILAGGGVLVIAAVVVLILVLTGGTDTSSARGVAEAAVKAINEKNTNAAREIDCNKGGTMGEFDITQIPGEIKAELTGEVKESGDSAEVPFKMTAQQGSFSGTMILKKKDGKWCVDDAKGS